MKRGIQKNFQRRLSISFLRRAEEDEGDKVLGKKELGGLHVNRYGRHTNSTDVAPAYLPFLKGAADGVVDASLIQLCRPDGVDVVELRAQLVLRAALIDEMNMGNLGVRQ